MPTATVFEEIITAKSLSIAKLERLLNLSYGAVRKAIERNSELKNETINKLIDLFPDLSEDYLRKGEGSLLPTRYPSEAIALNFVDETEVFYNSHGMEFRDLDNGMVLLTMPFVDEFAYASYPHGWKDREYVIELPKYSIILPKREQGLHRAFEVRGDSMHDGSSNSISFGDIAVGRLIDSDYWDQKLHVEGGTDYVIVTHDGIIIKRIVRHEVKEGLITCSSINPDKALYPDFVLRLSEVYELYKIRKVDRDWNRR